MRDSTKAYRPIYTISVVIRFIYERLYIKCICDKEYDWLRLNGMNVYVCMYRMTNGRLEVNFFFI